MTDFKYLFAVASLTLTRRNAFTSFDIEGVSDQKRCMTKNTQDKGDTGQTRSRTENAESLIRS